MDKAGIILITDPWADGGLVLYCMGLIGIIYPEDDAWKRPVLARSTVRVLVLTDCTMRITITISPSCSSTGEGVLGKKIKIKRVSNI